MFDLTAIRSVPLDVEILAKTKQGNVNIEQVRFTSLPGVRIYAVLTYADGAKSAPGYVVVERFRTKPLMEAAQNGFFGMEIAPPSGNMDPKKMESVGGPSYRQPFSIFEQFKEDKEQSYIYQYTVALLRAMDYLASRPEANIYKSVVSGYSWSGTPVALLHALDDRPGVFNVYHGLGFYVDEKGQSNGLPIPLSRKLYEMYCPAAYSEFGTRPLFAATALDDMYTKLDTIIEMYGHLKGLKAFVYSPNRHHEETSRKEFTSYAIWQSYWLGFTPDIPSTVGEGAFRVESGKLIYRCNITTKVPIVHAELLVSYGTTGNWMGRTWHRVTLQSMANSYEAEIPIYDPTTPLYAIAQIETEKFGAVGNGPLYVDPSLVGLSKANAIYPELIFDPNLRDDLYIRTGTVEWSPPASDGMGSAIIEPNDEGTITFQNVDALFWKGKKALSVWLKGDGKLGPVTAYFVSNPNYFLEFEKKNYTAIELVPIGSLFASGWKEYTIDLNKIANLEQVSSLFFYPGKRRLQIGRIMLK